MKALNRKLSETSQDSEYAPGDNVRSSVPPENTMNSNTLSHDSRAAPRAKSVSKEPGSRDSSLFAPSRFFSLGRRFAKIRFSSSSQPPPPVKSIFPSSSQNNITLESQMSQSQLLVAEAPKKKMKNRKKTLENEL